MRHVARSSFERDGEAVLLVGTLTGWLGQSLYLRDVCGSCEGAPPPVDLAAEKRNGDFVRTLVRGGRVSAVHDLSDGGLLVAVAEMTRRHGIGVGWSPGFADRLCGADGHAVAFGEDQGLYLLACRAESEADLLAAAAAAGVAAERIATTGGDALTLPGETPILVSELRSLHESWLPGFMNGAG